MWSSCGTTLADWVVSSLCQKSRVIDIPICSCSQECFLYKLINWHFFTAVHLSWNVDQSIELFPPSGFWLVTRNMSHRARRAHCSGEFGPMWRLPKEYLVESELLYGMYMCQPRARDQQSILLKAHWSFDILLIIPSQINQASQAATLRDILLVCNIWLYKEPWNLMQLFVWQEGHSSILFGQQNLGGKSAQIALIKSWNKTA